MFKKYMHLERLGSEEVNGITSGTVYVFPKLDGTNASVWLNEDGSLGAGSRNRDLTVGKDNAGFHQHVLDNKDKYLAYFAKHPNVTLYGEWLVPHSLKTYRDECWRKFYVFDVLFSDGEDFEYLCFDDYKDDLDSFGLDYLSPFAKVNNGSDEKFRSLTEQNIFYIKDGEGVGEGVVLKNYDFKNKYGRIVWAKIITNSFKEKHVAEMGGSEHGGEAIEEKIAREFVTDHLVEKSYAKIVNEDGWSSKSIPKLLGFVWHDLITEELWDILKKDKNPKIDFAFLNRMCIQRVKEIKSDLF